MRVNHHLMSQTSLYCLLGATAGLLVWGAANWSVYGLWHPGSGRPLLPDDFGAVRLQTILLLYLPLGIVLGGMIAILEPIRDTSVKSALQNEWSWLLRGILRQRGGYRNTEQQSNDLIYMW